MPISGGTRTTNYNVIQYDSTSGRITSLKVSYKTDYGTYFEMDGDIIMDRELKVEGSVDYVKD
jgi:hypothetical protein